MARSQAPLTLVVRVGPALGALALLAAPARGQELDDTRLAPAVRALADAAAARREGGDAEAARAALDAALAQLASGPQGVDLLARPADLGRALWLAERAGAPASPRNVRPGRVEEDVLTGGSFGAAGVPFAYRLPKSAAVPRDGYPLLLALPEPGERPAEHLLRRYGSAEALERFVVVVPSLPEDDASWTRVALAGRPGGVAHALAAQRVARERFPIDPDAVHLVAYGAATPVALETAAHAPHRLASLTLFGAEGSALGADNFRNVDTLFVGGGPLAERFTAGAAALGYARVSQVPALSEEQLVGRLRALRREPAPALNSVRVGQPFPTRVGGLRVASSAADSEAVCRFDRATNRVAVRATGVSSVTLHLSDAHLDLDRPVTFELNGEASVGRVRRSRAVLVERWLDGTSDPGAPYVAEAVLVPGVGFLEEEAAAPSVDADLDARVAAALAADDPRARADALWAVAVWCGTSGREARVVELARKVVRFDPEHGAARAALGHVRAPVEAGAGWFATEAARDRWLARQDPAFAPTIGLVEHGGRWMHPDDREPVTRGWRKDVETGLWWTPTDERRGREGWSRQDLAWLDPGESARADLGLWKVAGEWLPPATADRRHAELASAWRIPRWHAELWTTLDRDVALRALAAMEDALPALHAALGAEPRLPLRVAMARDEEQYDRLAFGDPDGRRAAVHAGRLHTVHSAFLAEGWFERDGKRFVHAGRGVGYWDAAAPNGDAYGYHAARLAFALSYVDALDPSPRAAARAAPKGPAPGFAAEFEAEKALPRWLRLGAAVYAERYFRDATAADRGGDAWWARSWSLDNLAQLGGLRPLDEVLAAELDADDRQGALRRLLELGALVAFCVDAAGEAPAVASAHAAVKAGLRRGRVKPAELEALEAALRANEAAVVAFVARR